MRVLFIHQNFPGQFKHLAPALAQRPGWLVVALGDQANIKDRPALPGVQMMGYVTPRPAGDATHHYLRSLESGVRRGQNVARALMQLRQDGFMPDLVFCHPGWGEGLFVRDVFPQAKLLSYLEFYYRAIGSDIGFDPEFPARLDDFFRIRLKNSQFLYALEDMDWGLSPTEWQRNQFPPRHRARISTIFDGVDTRIIRPDPDATVQVPDGGPTLGRTDEVITFVNRNLEPYRGFHVFMRALVDIQKARPAAHVLIVGGDEVSYGMPPADGANWREVMLKEVGDRLDLSRIHFLGRVPYGMFNRILRISSVHVYLTYPFVLSWSLLEAMATGCLIVGSRTPPVQEVVEHGHNGLLVNFFDREALVETVQQVLSRPDAFAPLRAAARQTIIDRYDLTSICLPAQMALVDTLLAGRTPDVPTG